MNQAEIVALTPEQINALVAELSGLDPGDFLGDPDRLRLACVQLTDAQDENYILYLNGKRWDDVTMMAEDHAHRRNASPLAKASAYIFAMTNPPLDVRTMFVQSRTIDTAPLAPPLSDEDAPVENSLLWLMDERDLRAWINAIQTTAKSFENKDDQPHAAEARRVARRGLFVLREKYPLA